MFTKQGARAYVVPPHGILNLSSTLSRGSFSPVLPGYFNSNLSTLGGFLEVLRQQPPLYSPARVSAQIQQLLLFPHHIEDEVYLPT